MMAASLSAVSVYLVFIWTSPLAVLGPPPEFGPLRWLGVLLLAGFAWYFMPLLPRVAATLAGMVAGPALFAIVGYLFVPECMPEYSRLAGDRSYAGSFGASLLALPIWAFGALWLWYRARSCIESHDPSSVLPFGIWSGAVMLGLAAWGTLSFTAC